MSDKPDRVCRPARGELTAEGIETAAERRRLLSAIVQNLLVGEGPIAASRIAGAILSEFPVEMTAFHRECLAVNLLNHALRLGLAYVYSIGYVVGGQDDVSFDATKAGNELEVWDLDPYFDGFEQPEQPAAASPEPLAAARELLQAARTVIDQWDDGILGKEGMRALSHAVDQAPF